MASSRTGQSAASACMRSWVAGSGLRRSITYGSSSLVRFMRSSFIRYYYCYYRLQPRTRLLRSTVVVNEHDDYSFVRGVWMNRGLRVARRPPRLVLAAVLRVGCCHVRRRTLLMPHAEQSSRSQQLPLKALASGQLLLLVVAAQRCTQAVAAATNGSLTNGRPGSWRGLFTTCST